MPALIPIYMFHRVIPKNAPGFEPYLCLTPAELDRQLQALQAWGFTFLTMEQAARLVNGEERPPQSRCAVLTFDDLDRDFREFAIPVLQARSTAATGFLVSADLEKGKTYNLPARGRPLAGPELADLLAAGVEIGSHTVTHRELPGLPPHEIAEELRASRQAIEDATGQPCRSLCYPRGRFDARVQEAAREAGYACACTTLRGNLHSPEDIFRLKRIRAHGRRTGMKLRYTTWRLYDWLNRGRCRQITDMSIPPAPAGGKRKGEE